MRFRESTDYVFLDKQENTCYFKMIIHFEGIAVDGSFIGSV